MTLVSFPKAGTSPSATVFVFRKPRFLAQFLEALHHSRRLQAQNFLKAHRHLLADSWDSSEQSRTGGGDNVDR